MCICIYMYICMYKGIYRVYILEYYKVLSKFFIQLFILSCLYRVKDLLELYAFVLGNVPYADAVNNSYLDSFYCKYFKIV